MNADKSIEERLELLEREVAELKQQAGRGKKHWFEETSGRMADIPKEDFDEFVRLGREARDAQTDPGE